jgi:hypothetical protein
MHELIETKVKEEIIDIEISNQENRKCQVAKNSLFEIKSATGVRIPPKSSYHAIESRDERKARLLGIPFSMSDLIDSPMDHFITMINITSLTKDQITFCKAVRRRGKNKVAAQKSRIHKVDQISNLELEVKQARQHKQLLLAEREQLYQLNQSWSMKLQQLEEQVLHELNRDVNQFALQLTQDRQEVHVTKRPVIIHAFRVTKQF